MKEHFDLIREWRALGPNPEAILATVVATRGSVYRKAGARMLLTRERWLAGSISGGCIESDVLQTAWERTEKGPVLVTYDASPPEDALLGYGLGCNGVADVLLERLPSDGGALAVLEQVLETRRPAHVATAISPGPQLGKRWSDFESLPNGVEFLCETLSPPPSLVLFGAGHDALPLARLANEIGWHVTVVDARSAYVSKDRFPDADRLVVAAPAAVTGMGLLEPGSAVVLMTHSFLQDLELLKWLAPVHEGYLGLLGPRSRTERLLAEAGFPDRQVYAPIGLDLGSAGPDEIALAIVAEILAVFKGHSGGHLSKRGSP